MRSLSAQLEVNDVEKDTIDADGKELRAQLLDRGAGPHNMDHKPTRWPESPRIVMRCAEHQMALITSDCARCRPPDRRALPPAAHADPAARGCGRGRGGAAAGVQRAVEEARGERCRQGGAEAAGASADQGARPGPGKGPAICYESLHFFYLLMGGCGCL